MVPRFQLGLINVSLTDARTNQTGAGGVTFLTPLLWSPIQTSHADGNGLFQFTDHGATNQPQRFYRATSP